MVLDRVWEYICRIGQVNLNDVHVRTDGTGDAVIAANEQPKLGISSSLSAFHSPHLHLLQHQHYARLADSADTLIDLGYIGRNA